MQDIDLGNVVGEVNPDSVIEFETPESYSEISSGDSIKTIFGKIKKGLKYIFVLINNTLNNTEKIIDATPSTTEWTGEWSTGTNPNYHNGTIMMGGLFVQTGEYVQFNFTGYGITAYSLKEKNEGIMGVYIDDVFIKDIDLYAAETKYKQAIFEIKNLEYKSHTIKLVKTGNKNEAAEQNWINIDYFEIATGDDLLTPRISKSFATNNWNMIPAAPLVKELKENVTTINDALNGLKFYGGSAPLTFQSTTQLGNSTAIDLTALNINEIHSITVSINFYDDISSTIQKTDRVFANRGALDGYKLLYLYANANDADYTASDAIWVSYNLLYK